MKPLLQHNVGLGSDLPPCLPSCLCLSRCILYFFRQPKEWPDLPDLEQPRKSGHLLLARKFLSPLWKQSSCYTSRAPISWTCQVGERWLIAPDLFSEVTGKFSRFKNKYRMQRFANRPKKKKRKITSFADLFRADKRLYFVNLETFCKGKKTVRFQHFCQSSSLKSFKILHPELP